MVNFRVGQGKVRGKTVVPKTKSVFKILWGHVKRRFEGGSLWENLEQSEHQNDDRNRKFAELNK